MLHPVEAAPGKLKKKKRLLKGVRGGIGHFLIPFNGSRKVYIIHACLPAIKGQMGFKGVEKGGSITVLAVNFRTEEGKRGFTCRSRSFVEWESCGS